MTRAPHILIVVDSLGCGGAEMYAVQLANALAARDVAVSLAAGVHAGNTLAPDVAPDVRQLELPWRWYPSKAAQVRGLGASALALARYARGAGVTTVQTVLPATMLAGWYAARRAGVPIVHTPMQVSGMTSRLHHATSRWTLRRLDLIVALSDYLYADTRAAFGTSPERTVVCRLGIDIDRFMPGRRSAVRAAMGIPESLPVVGICTGLRPDKDPMLALRAFAALRARRPAAFVVVGDGEMRPEMEAFVAREGLTADVHFAGHCADVRTVVPAFDLYLETCRGPNLGLAPLEALAMGVPLLVATRDAEEARMAADTLVDGQAGWTALAAPDVLAQAIDAYAARPPEVRAALSRAARATAERYYRWDVHTDSMEAHYRRLAR